MKLDQLQINSQEEISYIKNGIEDKNNANIVLVFGDRMIFDKFNWYDKIRSIYPLADIISSTSSGDISDINLTEDILVATSIFFEKTEYKIKITNNQRNEDSISTGEKLAEELLGDNLKHVFIISDGQKINGSELIKGFKNKLPENIDITGGLAGDSTRFEMTIVGLNDNINAGNVVAIGFYGNQIKIGFGSKGGWDPFGPIRVVTKSENNILFEFDGENALDLYKIYLGDKAKQLPASSLLFPLGIHTDDGKIIVRTVLSIDENMKSMTFAGDIPNGSRVQLMKANFDKLIEGAADAAVNAQKINNIDEPDLAILVSCVGRKLVLGQRIEDELEAIQNIFGFSTVLTGFYSYGEVCPSKAGIFADLHNQTMTITTLTEI